MRDHRSRARSKKGNNGRDTTIHIERVLDHKITIVGSSDLATNLAHQLDAVRLSAITDTGSLENFRGVMAEESGLIKAVFIDSWTTPLDFNATPSEVNTYLLSAADIAIHRCKGHNHANAALQLGPLPPLGNSC